MFELRDNSDESNVHLHVANRQQQFLSQMIEASGNADGRKEMIGAPRTTPL